MLSMYKNLLFILYVSLRKNVTKLLLWHLCVYVAVCLMYGCLFVCVCVCEFVVKFFRQKTYVKFDSAFETTQSN